MKKLFTLLLALGLTMLVNTSTYDVMAQDGEGEDTTQAAQTDSTATDSLTVLPPAPPKEEEPEEVQELLKRYFIEGGWQFMGIVLVCLILGLAICIERILSLGLASANTTSLLKKVEGALQEGDVDRAKEICRATRGPVASIFYQGLDRVHEGIDIVEKSIVSYGSVQMGRLERGLIWIGLLIALAPMLGFMGTVLGMIEAFDAIEKAGDISPGLVAGGIKIALLTTVFGLVVAIILQIFYNYIISKIDGLVNKMEDASISLVDLLLKYNVAGRK